MKHLVDVKTAEVIKPKQIGVLSFGCSTMLLKSILFTVKCFLTGIYKGTNIYHHKGCQQTDNQ